MKRKGFTLIELLAVIVILAIIALIATPIVLNIIENSKDSSNKRSIELYGSAVEQAVSREEINGKTLPSGKYTTEDGKTLKQGDAEIKVDYKGSKVVCDVYITNDGEVSLKNCKINDKATEYIYGEKIYENGEIVYFDVLSGKQCSEKEYNDSYGDVTVINEKLEKSTIQDYQNSNTGYNGTNPKDKQNSCLKFYAFNDDGGQTVNILLDHNTTLMIAWNNTDRDSENYSTNVNGPNEVLTQLKKDTDSWKGTETPTNYTMDQRGQGSNAYYTIDYSGYKARLITANEIAKITGNTSWDEITATTFYHFDSNTNVKSDTCTVGNTSGCKYGWLYDRTNTLCTGYGCLNNSDIDSPFGGLRGYWTASSRADDSRSAWEVYCSGLANYYAVEKSYNFGVRPVIEVLKSKLN